MKHEPSLLEIFLTRLAFLLRGKSVYKAFADRLPLDGGAHVLDFGCGMGSAAYYTQQKLPDGQLTCLDISGRWLKACRKTLRKAKNVAFLQSDASALSENSFDTVYCHFVLHDIPESELEAVIPALAKSLKPGGALVFREPLREAEQLRVMKRLFEESGLSLQKSRVTDVPLMGNALESTYTKP
jgi:ubiquinone/menaquinone biosynthesis C-methylase UbiE